MHLLLPPIQSSELDCLCLVHGTPDVSFIQVNVLSEGPFQSLSRLRLSFLGGLIIILKQIIIILLSWSCNFLNKHHALLPTRGQLLKAQFLQRRPWPPPALLQTCDYQTSTKNIIAFLISVKISWISVYVEHFLTTFPALQALSIWEFLTAWWAEGRLSLQVRLCIYLFIQRPTHF